MTNNTDSLVNTLKQMVKCCQDMQILLQTDNNHFIKNDLPGLEQNNNDKAELLNKLNLIVSELNTDYVKEYPGGFLEHIAQDISSLNSAAQKEVSSVLDDLKSEIVKCYHYIITNSNIVFANLRQLKEIWDSLLAREPDMACVYDQKGRTTE